MFKTLICSLLIFLSTSFASAENFRVDATYTKPDFSDRGIEVKMSHIVDHLNFEIETKNDYLNIIANVINLQDGKTSYIEDMNPDFSVGEYCVGVQTPVGSYEAFKLKESPSVHAITVRRPVPIPPIKKPPGTPDLPPGYPMGIPSTKITTAFEGFEHLRGWDFSVEQILCNIQNVPEEDTPTPIDISLEFDSKDLKAPGSSVVVDQTVNGFGWVFTVTKE